MKKSKKEKTKKRLQKMYQATIREEMVKQGFYNRPNVRAHKDKSKYSRKNKHRKPPIE